MDPIPFLPVSCIISTLIDLHFTPQADLHRFLFFSIVHIEPLAIIFPRVKIMLLLERFVYRMVKYLALSCFLSLYTPAAQVRSDLFTGNMVRFSVKFSGMVTSTPCAV